MTEIKKDIEQYFIDNWTLTPIQFDGTMFTAPDKWIKIQFIPIGRVLYATGHTKGRKKDIMIMKVSSFDVSTTYSMALEDEVRTFIECEEINGSFVDIGTPSGDGAVPLENDLWISVSTYEITNYN